MRYCVKTHSLALIRPVFIGLVALLIAGCDQPKLEYGFVISDVSVNPAYQALDVRLRQDLDLSQQAHEALEYGVTLTIRVDMELRNDNDMIVVRRETRRFHIRYLPLIERFQVRQGEWYI